MLLRGARSTPVLAGGRLRRDVLGIKEKARARLQMRYSQHVVDLTKPKQG